MNRLTDRLQLIADRIGYGDTVADIGTDHGLLPLYLYDKGISPKVIMSDISEPSLDKARVAFAERYGKCEEKGRGYEFRVGDGLTVLDDKEVDTVVIAGMGGLLIRDILADDINKSLGIKKLILQPRNNSGQLRYWLMKNGFTVPFNLLVREGKFICEVIVATPVKMAMSNMEWLSEWDFEDPGSATWEYPRELIERHPELGLEYAKIKLSAEMKIRDGILKSCNVNESDLAAVERRIEWFEWIIGEAGL